MAQHLALRHSVNRSIQTPSLTRWMLHPARGEILIVMAVFENIFTGVASCRHLKEPYDFNDMTLKAIAAPY